MTFISSTSAVSFLGAPPKTRLCTSKTNRWAVEVEGRTRKSPASIRWRAEHQLADAAEVLEPELVIEGTPGFTRHMSSSPMPKSVRAHYVQMVARAVGNFLDAIRDGRESNNLAELTMLLPELNPELDVYSRRFILNLAWGVVLESVQKGLKARVCVQAPQGSFGGLPLAVSGLRRTFERDRSTSAEGWGGVDEIGDAVRLGDISPDAIQDDDDVIILLSPTNAIGMPVVHDVRSMAQALGERRPMILVNAHLRTMPGPTSTVSIQDDVLFLDKFEPVFHLRPLYKAGTLYPIVGLLYRSYPSPFQLYRRTDNPSGETYALIRELEQHIVPSSDQIYDAFQQDRTSRMSSKEGVSPAFSLIALAALAVGAVVYFVVNSDIVYQAVHY